MPLTALAMSDESNDSDSPVTRPGGLSAMKCRFGRFGEATAVFLNSTTIKCTTPPADDPADSIYREAVSFGVAMNGYDFQEELSPVEFTFVGTAPYISFATIVMTLLAIAFVGFAGTLFTSDYYQVSSLRSSNFAPGSGGHRGGRDGMLRSQPSGMAD